MTWEEFQEVCIADLNGNPSMTPGSDECAAQVFCDESADIGQSAIVQELFSTSSVTVVVQGRQFEISLNVKEVLS